MNKANAPHGTSSPTARFTHFLSDRGLRLTGQRRIIAELFFRSEGHHSAEEIARMVREANPGIGPATVYRTIKLLREAGLATGMNTGDGLARYESPLRRSHHDHLVCRHCGRIVEFENDQIEALQQQVAERHGFVVTDHRLELFGICGACRNLAR
ncbi:MAG: Fur family transcriptional regulator [Candidatus Geothermincolia bacterium]